MSSFESVTMPRHKQPPSLSTLSTSAAAQLVLTSLLKMDGMTLAARKEALVTVQDVLLDGILPSMWDSLFDAVQASQTQFKEISSSWVYSIFVHENLKKFTLTNTVIDATMSSKLKNVVELDLTCMLDIEVSPCLLVGKVCQKLQRVKLAGITVPDSYVALAGCSELKSLSYNWIKDRTIHGGDFAVSSEFIAAKLALDLFPSLEHYNFSKMGKVLVTLDTTKTLNLRYVKDDNCTVANITRIIALCPHLQRLDANSYPHYSSCSPALEALATSSLEIRDLTVTVTHFDENFRHFIEKKGRYLLKFTLHSPPIAEQAAQLISKCCSNLTHLTLQNPLNLRSPSPANTLSFPEKKCQSSLTKLEKLAYNSQIPFLLDIDLFKTLLPKDSRLSSLEIQACQVKINEFLTGLMKSVAMNRLEELNVLCAGSAVLLDRVIRETYVHFPSLKRLVLGCAMDQQVRSCLEEIRRDVREKNLDFVVSCFNL